MAEIEQNVSIELGEEIGVEDIADGAVAEHFKLGLTEVMANIADFAFVGKTTRVLTLTISLTPADDRKRIAVNVESSTKLAKRQTKQTELFLRPGRDGNTLTVTEFNPQQPKFEMK